MDPCQFPSLNEARDPDAVSGYRIVDPAALRVVTEFCACNRISVNKVILGAWAIILRQFADVEVVSFGQTSGTNLTTSIVAVDDEIPIQKFLGDIDCQQAGSEVNDGSYNTIVCFLSDANYSPGLEHLKCDIALHSTGSSLGIHYMTSLLSPKQAERLCSTVSQTLRSLIDKWNGRIRDIESLSPEDREDILQWNKQVISPLHEKSVTDIIGEQVKDHPEAQSVCAWDGEFTYAELEDASSRLSSYLQHRGIGPGMLVPICFVKSRWSIVAMLAILKAGAGIVPLDPAQPVDRLKHIVGQVDARVILVAEQTAELLVDAAEVLVVSKTTTSQLTTTSSSTQPWSTLSAQPGLVMFTSGSTGEPKGCVFNHNSLSFTQYQGRKLGIHQGTRVFQFASCSFMVSIADIFCGLTNGGTICIPSDYERLNNLTEAFNRLKADFLHATPSVISSLDPQKVPGLKIIAAGGEPLTDSLAETWGGKVNLTKVYGQSEWVCTTCIQPDIVHTKTTNVGRAPVARTWLVMPNDPLRLAPVGAVAELCIAGPSLTAGFLNDSKKTAESFIENPPWCRPGEETRIYKTGDLVRYNSDGSLNILGRKGMMVKILGQRVELGEVEYQLKRSFLNATAVVADTVAPSGGDGTRILTAFIGPPAQFQSNGAPTTFATDSVFAIADPTFRSLMSDAHKSVTAVLPRWMAPAIYLPLKSVPMTVSGKINRRVLRESAGKFTRRQLEGFSSAEMQKVSPTTAMECEIHSAAAQILGLETDAFGVQDSFFSLGGDSLKAMRLVSSLLENDIIVSVEEIFNEKTISKLALVAKKKERSLVPSEQPVYQPFDLLPATNRHVSKVLDEKLQAGEALTGTIEDAYPCSPTQQGILLSQIRNPSQYQILLSWELLAQDGNAVHIDRLAHAWRTLVRYHPSLRTVILHDALENQAFTQVLFESGLEPHVIHSDSEDNILDIIESNRCSRTAGKTLPRFSILQTPSNRVFCALEINHTFFDATSSAILTRDLTRAYDDTLARKDGPRYCHYLAYLQSLSGQDSLNYWKLYLDGCSHCYFPTLNESQSTAIEEKCRLVNVQLPGELAIRDFCQTYGLTLSNIFQVAWGLVLKAFTGSETVCFGYMTSGRDAPISSIQDTIGVFINLLLCRVDFTDASPIIEILKKTQMDFIKCLPHQHLPLAEVLQDRDMSGSAMFNTAMSLTLDAASKGASGTISFNELSHEDDTEYDIWLEATASENCVEASLMYQTSVLSENQAKGIAGAFSQAISEIISKPNHIPSALDLVSTNDHQRMTLWNSCMPEAEMECIHDLISLRCVETPTAPAVCAWDGDFTYAELDQLSTQFAKHLARHGVVPDMLVPLCFEKSRWTTVAILGVLKAGGAFVLLDPSHPAKRLQDMCSAFNASVAVVSAVVEARELELAPNAIPLGDDNQTWEEEDSKLPRASPKNLAYAVFTSGSTGKPKGVLIEHSTFGTMAREYLKVTHSDRTMRFLQFASYAFDVSVSDHLATLIAGGCICIPSELERNGDLPGAINRMKVTCADLTPSFLRSMQSDDIPSVKTIILGGEPMSRADIAKWSEKVRMVNVYGPAECGVGSTVQPCVTLESNPYNIGFPTGGVCWVVDKSDHEKLMPVGAIGELLIEGPIVGRGYLNEPEKTSQVFIDAPSWLSRYRTGGGRMYKTGDLAHFAEDGSLRFMGRKDMQVKLRGQRIELGEVEYHVGDIFDGAQEVVADVIKIMGRPQLVAFVFCDGQSDGVKAADDFFASPTTEFRSKAASAESRLQETVPSFMVPGVFVPLSYVPLTKTAKTDRRRLRERAAEGLEMYIALQAAKRPPSTEVETILQEVWANVLNISLDNIGVDDSFFRLGGDSITAMQVSAKARARGISLSVSDIFRHKTIAASAPPVKKEKDFKTKFEERFDTWFDLSPIQKMFFEENPHGHDHFNQGFVLEISPKVETSSVKQAVNHLATQHSMLRANFGKNENREWSQRIRSTVEGSYHFKDHGLNDIEELKQVVAATNASLNIENGPVFAVDLMTVGEKQYISLMVHHLVMDLASWRILLADLEELLKSASLSGMPSTPFQTWCQLQADYGRQYLPLKNALPTSILPKPEQYWGSENVPKTSGDAKGTSFTVDQNTTNALLGTANEAFGTKPAEILQAALLASFVQTFKDRLPPIIFNEGHGRETWTPDIDLSRTVGCFTTLWPTCVEVTTNHSIKEFVRSTKDAIRAVPSNGWEHMVSRYHNPEGRSVFGGHGRPEIIFNSLGLSQQLESTDTILKSTNIKSILNLGNSLERSSLFDVAVLVKDGSLVFNFQWNKHLKHQEMIEAWIGRCEGVLEEAAKELSLMTPTPTLCDYSLPGLTYAQLDHFLTEILPTLTPHTSVETIYPCSPMQHLMLDSQSRNATYYAPSTIGEALSTQSDPLDLEKLQRAWQMLVDRHSILRTIFVEDFTGRGGFIQLTLSSAQANIHVLECSPENALSELNSFPPAVHKSRTLPHHLTLCRGLNGKVNFKLEVSHAIIDAVFAATILQEWQLAYDNELPSLSPPPFSKYLDYIGGLDHSETDYWKTYLSDVSPCLLPSATFSKIGSLQNIPIKLTRGAEIFDFCHKTEVTLSALIKSAWALVLRTCANADAASFGYIVSGRHVPIEGVQDIVGPLLSLLICHVKFGEGMSHREVWDAVQTNYEKSLATHLGVIPALNELKLSPPSRHLFNTMVNHRRHDGSDVVEDNASVNIQELSAQDAMEFEIVLQIDESKNAVTLSMDYWNGRLPIGAMEEIVQCFDAVMCGFLECADGTGLL